MGGFLKRYLEPANLVMFYLMVVVFSAVRWGRGPAIVSAVFSVLMFDFFLVRPYLTLAVADLQYLFTFAGLLIVGFITSELTVKARGDAEKTRQLELLRATEKLQAALLNSISHDLRTPLSSIIGTTSMLLQDPESLAKDTVKELLEDALEESQRLNRIVGNLLDMARLEGGALKIVKKPCELRDILGVALQDLKYKLGTRIVHTSVPHHFPEVLVDFPLIVKVFVNLLDNAIKYSPENSPVDILAVTEGTMAKIEISDQGYGIRESDLPLIFDKFYRAVKPEQVSGLGLGLSICRGIVEAHGGRIWAESLPNKQGATLTILLPLN